MSNCCENFSAVDITNAYARIKNKIHYTPILTSTTLNALTGKKLYFKCENFQKTGSFKSRGALNAVMSAMERTSGLQGVITHSSGNHGQALAWASVEAGLPKCITVVPHNASNVKKQAMRHYGATLIECEASQRKLECERLSVEFGFPIIDPHDDFDVMAGQGTIAIEVFEEFHKQFNAIGPDAILVSVGGGGLASGIAKYAKSVKPSIKVFCVEPCGKSLENQFKSGIRNSAMNAEFIPTIADGIRIRFLGAKCFPVLAECSEHTVLTLDDDDIQAAMKLIWQYLKVVIEPSAALPLAAVLKYPNEFKDMENIVLILCGGNLNIDDLTLPATVL